jgi:hypothetical protein
MLILRFLAGSRSRQMAHKPSYLFRRALRLTLVAAMGIAGLETPVNSEALVDALFF